MRGCFGGDGDGDGNGDGGGGLGLVEFISDMYLVLRKSDFHLDYIIVMYANKLEVHGQLRLELPVRKA
jgi:hypothetical protein